jgi:hypothetical protein
MQMRAKVLDYYGVHPYWEEAAKVFGKPLIREYNPNIYYPVIWRGRHRDLADGFMDSKISVLQISGGVLICLDENLEFKKECLTQ